MSEFMTRFAEGCGNSWHANVGTPLLRFVTHGDRQALENAKKNVTSSFGLYWLNLWEYLGPPAELSDEEKRAMEAAVCLGKADDIAKWLKSHLDKGPADETAYLAAYLAAFGSGKTSRAEAAATMITEQQDGWLERNDSRPNAAGCFLLSLSEAELAAASKIASWRPAALRFLLKHVPSRVPPLLQDVLVQSSRYASGGKYLDADACGVLLEHDAARYEKEIAAAFRAEERLGPKFNAGVELSRVDREKYHLETRQTGQAMLASDNWAGNSRDICKWLIEQYQEGALEDIATYLRWHDNLYVTEPVLRNTIDSFAEAARPAVVASLENPTAGLRLIALEQLVKWDREADHELILEQFRRNWRSMTPRRSSASLRWPAVRMCPGSTVCCGPCSIISQNRSARPRPAYWDGRAMRR